jgi:prepilin-type N-terminal cleavage/methylation domain-containing protein
MKNRLAVLKKKKNKKGFTLIELVIVIAVLGIIAGIAIPTVNNVIGNANEAADQSNRQSVELTLKTAAAQIQSGTMKSINKDSTVKDVLSVYGIDGLPELKKYKKYTYNKNSQNGKIGLDESGTDIAAIDVKDDKNLTKLSDIISFTT